MPPIPSAESEDMPQGSGVLPMLFGEVEHPPHGWEAGDVQKVCNEMLIENRFFEIFLT